MFGPESGRRCSQRIHVHATALDGSAPLLHDTTTICCGSSSSLTATNIKRRNCYERAEDDRIVSDDEGPAPRGGLASISETPSSCQSGGGAQVEFPAWRKFSPSAGSKAQAELRPRDLFGAGQHTRAKSARRCGSEEHGPSNAGSAPMLTNAMGAAPAHSKRVRLPRSGGRG